MWKYRADGSGTSDNIFSSPVLASDGTIVFSNTEDYLYALNSDGTLRWKHLINDLGYGTALIDGADHVYVNSVYDLLCYSIDGNLLWSSELYGLGVAPLAMDDQGVLYVRQNYHITAIVPEPTAIGMITMAGAFLLLWWCVSRTLRSLGGSSR